jgi:hypothetical protein
VAPVAGSATLPPGAPRGRPDWHRLLAVDWITSFIDGFGVAQVYAFLPNRLLEVGTSTPEIECFVGSEMAYSEMSLLIHDIERTSLRVTGSVGLVRVGGVVVAAPFARRQADPSTS